MDNSCPNSFDCWTYLFAFEMIPSSYADLTPKQLKEVLPLVLQMKGFGATADYALQILNKLCSTLKVSITEAEKLSWLWSKKIEKKPFKFVRIGWRFYWLPEENYSNTSGIELAMSNIFYLRFVGQIGKKGEVIKKPDFEALADLMAVVCRPIRWDFFFRKWRHDWDGDIRVPYNSLKSEAAAKRFKKLPIGEALAVLSYWENMNEQFLNIYSEVFESDESIRPLFKNGDGWLATLEDVAKDDVHGNFTQVGELNAHTIFMYLKHRKIIMMEQIRQSEKE